MANLPHAPWLHGVDFIVQADAQEMARQKRARDISSIELTDAEIKSLVAFMHALTGSASVKQPPFGVPPNRPDLTPSQSP